MNFDLKLGKAASVVFLALAIAGCGGGGSTTTMPEPPMPAVQQRADVQTALNTARDAVSMLDPSSSDAMVSTAESAVADAATAIEEATDVPATEIAAFNTALGTIRDTLANAKTRIADARRDAADKAKMAATDLAKRIAQALATPADRLQTSPVTAITAAISRSSSAMPTIEIAAAGGTAARTSGFESSDAMASAIAGWHGEVQERDGAASTDPVEMVTIYTNIDAPKMKSVSFDTYYAAARAGTSGAISDGAVPIKAALLPAERDLFMSSDFPSGSRMQYTYGSGDDDQADASAAEGGISGSFNGVLGKFFCDASCTASTDQNGKLQSFGGTWTFNPDSDSAMVMQSTADADYLYFGWWLESTKTATSNSYRFHAFSGGMRAFAAAITGLTGKAKYEGPAAGMYVTKTFDAGGLESAESGTFTATAMLEADFDDGTEAGTVSGEITGFMAGGMSQDDWSVKLNSSAADAIGTASEVAGKIGDATSTGGQWTATFFENGPTDATGDLAHPRAIAGEFDAHFPAAHIAGAFGADVQ